MAASVGGSSSGVLELVLEHGVGEHLQVRFVKSFGTRRATATWGSAARTAAAGPLARRALGEGKKCQLPGGLDCQGNLTLLEQLPIPPGTNLAPIGHELAQEIHVLVVDPSGGPL